MTSQRYHPRKGKSNMKRRVSWIATLLCAVAATFGAITAAPAAASSFSNVCGSGGTGYCLNDWNGGGSGNAVKMYYGGYANDHFGSFEVNACDGGAVIRSDCLSAWSGDTALVGAIIVRVVYQNNSSLCVATNTSGDTVLGACGDSTGSGAANGVIMAVLQAGSCTGGNQSYFTDRYWDHQYGQDTWMTSGGNIGIQAFLNNTSLAASTCWGVITA